MRHRADLRKIRKPRGGAGHSLPLAPTMFGTSDGQGAVSVPGRQSAVRSAQLVAPNLLLDEEATRPTG